MTLAGEPSEPRLNETFRVSQDPARRSRQGVPPDVEDVFAYVEKDTRRSAKVDGMERAKQIHSSVPAPAPSLPLARTTLAGPGVQQESTHTSRHVTKENDEIKVEPRFASDTTEARPEAELAQPVSATTETPTTSFPALPLSQAKAAKRREPIVNEAPAGQPLTAKENASVKNSPPVLPLVQEQNPASQFQTGAPQFVWRKSADALTMGDLLSDLSSSPLAAVRQALDALPVAQSRPSNQSVKPVPPGREDRVRTGDEITTEGMLRRISTMLLIERERRGY